MNKKAMIALMGLAAAGAVAAANIDVTSDITTSTTWTSNNVYNLTAQIYVQPGATLTIQPGTLIQSTTGVGGSLAVCRGAKIYANGTKNAPIIMTSTDDDLVSWHEGCNEWGNLTIMGKGLISASHYAGVQVGSNTKTPTGLNEKQMEGLTGGSETYYGGNDDDDDSGSISYLSLRYGGKVIGLANELNGLSMGGVGRETDVHHVEIMNNVDDGIETWGGTVNYKYISIWNVGDDSMDVDEGWRGKAQFGLIVQGYSKDASQGSGVGDNCFEIDGAEDSDAQPVTTTKIANFTVIGQPLKGDGACTYRDNARVQYHNSLFLDIGEEIIRLDNVDGDGANGYGYNGTLSWAATWTTPYSTYSSVNWTNIGPYGDNQAAMYPVQTSGFLNEMKGCAFNYCNESDSGDQILALGILNGTSGAWESNVALDNIVSTNDVIGGFAREDYVTRGGLSVANVTNINPCAVGVATTVANPESADGFYEAAAYRGAFSPNYNWLEGWTAVSAYGMTDTSMNGAGPTASIATGMVVSFQTEAGAQYAIERADSASGPWAEAMTVIGDGSYKAFGDADLQAAEFYRVVLR